MFHIQLDCTGTLVYTQMVVHRPTEYPRLPGYNAGAATTPSHTSSQTHIHITHKTQSPRTLKASCTHAHTGAHRHTQPHSHPLGKDAKPNRTFPHSLQLTLHRYTPTLGTCWSTPSHGPSCSLPSHSAGHTGAQAATQFPNFFGEAKVAFSRRGVGRTEPQVPEVGGAEG